MATQANTPADFAPVFIGITPAGCEWVAYRAEAVETMTSRLAALQARHAAKQAKRAAPTTRRVKLTTEAQHEMLVRFLADDSTATLRKTYIETTEAELAELAQFIEDETADAMTAAADGAMTAQSDQEVAFAAIAGGMSCAILAARLRGQRINKRVVRNQLAREWR